jgi:hypothetical protein
MKEHGYLFLNCAVQGVSQHAPIMEQITKLVKRSSFHPKEVYILCVREAVYVVEVIMPLLISGRYRAICDRKPRTV